MYGSQGEDIIKAKGGDDWVYGEGGDDSLYSDGSFWDPVSNTGSRNTGNDHLYGGSGNDGLTAAAAWTNLPVELELTGSFSTG